MNPNETAAIYLSNGNQLLEEGNLEEAIAAFRSAIELNPDLSWSHHNLGEALAKLGQLEEALAAYRRAIELNPDFSWSYHHLGDVLERQQQWEESVAAFHQAIELNPEHFGSYVGLGKSLEKLGHLDEAIAAYRRASELAPQADWIHYRLGEVLQQRTQMDLEGAIVSYRRAIELNPDDVQAYRKLLQIEPDNLEVLLQLGKALVKQEQWEEAIVVAQKAVELNPNSETFQHNLDKVLAEKKIAYEEEITEKVEHSLKLEKALIEQKTIEEAIADWRRNGELNSQADNSLLNRLEPISSFPIYPEQLAIRSGQFVEKGTRKHLVSPIGNQGLVSWGPYINVPNGLYRVKIDFEFPDQTIAPNGGKSETVGFTFDLATDSGRCVWHEGTVYTSQKEHGFFIELVKATKLEIRFKATGVAFTLNFMELTLIYKPAESTGGADYYLGLGGSLEKQKKLSLAAYAYRRAIELNPQYLQNGIAAWQQAVDTQPDAQEYLNLGLFLVHHNLKQEALTIYQKALKAQPEKIKFDSQLISSIVEQGYWESLVDCYEHLNEGYPHLAVKAYHNLAIVLAKQGMMEQALQVFHKASPNPAEDYIYQRIWRGLNQLTIDDNHYRYPPEISPEATYKYFTESSNYKFIKLWSLSKEERNLLEKAGLSIENLELIAQDDLELEEIYINSFEAQPQIQLSRKGSKHSRVNRNIYETDNRYFQNSIVETGYIYSICPIRGQVLRSNQSFTCHAPHPGVPGSWHPIHIYRFVGAEIFYLVCAVMPVGGKSFIYIPSLELVISFVPSNTCYASEPQIINMLKSSLVSHWQSVQSYISNDEKKEVVVDLGWCYNLAHYVWNEMSGLQYLWSNGTLQKVDKFLIGNYEYIRVGDSYPEIEPGKLICWDTPEDSWNLFKTIVDNNYMAVSPTDWIVQEELGDRIYQGAVRRSSENLLEEVAKAQEHFPLIWIGIRCHHRIWISQVEGIANIIKSLSLEFPKLGIVFDGWGRQERENSRSELEIQKVNAVLQEIQSLLPSHVKTYSLNEAMNYEKAVWAKAVGFYIAPEGAGLTFPVWITNKPGVMYGVAETRKTAQETWSSGVREKAVESVCVSIDHIDNHLSSGFSNYEIDWKNIYNEAIRLLKEIPKKMV